MAVDKLRVSVELDKRKAEQELDKLLAKKYLKLELEGQKVVSRELEKVEREQTKIKEREAKKRGQIEEKIQKRNISLQKEANKEFQKTQKQLEKLNQIKISSSVDSSELDKFEQQLGNVSKNVKNFGNRSKINLSLKVDNAEDIPKLNDQVDKLRKKTKSDINVRFNVKQDSNIFNQINKSVQRGSQAVQGVAGALGGAAFFTGLNNLRGAYASIDDQLTDVAKTTGLTKQETQEFKDEIFELSKGTRTQIPDLLGIAEIGGQLGIAKDEIKDFTEDVNILNVALGKEFGGVDILTEQLGKIAIVADDVEGTTSDKLLFIGNAVNELAARTNSKAPNIAENLTRIQGSAPFLSTGASIGIASALDQLNIKAELGGSSVGRLIAKFADADAIPAFAEQLGITNEEFANLVNTAPEKVLVDLAKSMEGNIDSATEFNTILDELGINNTRDRQVFAKIADGADQFTKSIDIANESLTNTDSILNEYNQKNENAAAAQEKFNNRLIILRESLGEALFPAFTKVIEKITPFVDKLAEFANKEPNITAGVAGLTSAVVALGLALQTIQFAGLDKLAKFGFNNLGGKAAKNALFGSAGKQGLVQAGAGKLAGSAAGKAVVAGALPASLVAGAAAASVITVKLAYDKNFLGFKETLDDIKEGKFNKKSVGGATGGLVGALGGAKAGAAAGGAIGATFGGVGAVPGAIAGGLLGGAAGLIGGQGLGRKLGELIPDEVFEKLNEFKDLGVDTFNTIINKGAEIRTNIITFFTDAYNGVTQYFSGKTFGEIFNDILFVSGKAVGKITKFFVEDIPNSVESFREKAQQKVIDFGISASVAVATFALKTIRFFTVDLPQNIESFRKVAIQKMTEFKDRSVVFFTRDLPKAVIKFALEAPKNIAKFNEAVKTKLKELPNQVFEIGKSIATKIGDGMKAFFSGITDISSFLGLDKIDFGNFGKGFFEGFGRPNALGGFVSPITDFLSYQVGELGDEVFKGIDGSLQVLSGGGFKPAVPGQIIPAAQVPEIQGSQVVHNHHYEQNISTPASNPVLAGASLYKQMLAGLARQL